MNKYTEIKSWLDNTDRKRFSREMVEGLIAEHEALRRENAELRKAQPYKVTQIAPAPLHVSDDEILFFEPVPVVILREVE